jgi:hypothetical protein
MALSTIETYKLLSSDHKNMGQSVASDGNYIITGAPQDNDQAEDSGAAYIFKNDGYGNFIELEKIVADVGQYRAYFGGSIAISGDYAIIGAAGDNTQGSNAGAAYIFKNNGHDHFVQIDKITASDGISGHSFGREVAISGNYVIIAAHGAAYIFKNDGNGHFSQINKLTIPKVYKVAINGDYALVGVEPYTTPDPVPVYIFKNDGADNFTQIAQLDGSTSYADRFGSSVAINDNYVAIGSHGDDSVPGSVWLYQNDGADHFNYIGTLTPSEQTPGNRFGCSIAMLDNYIVVGSWLYGMIEYSDMTDTGAAFIFKKDTHGNFVEIVKLTASDTAHGDGLGKVVTISDEYAVTTAKDKYAYVYSLQDTILPVKSYKIKSFSGRNSNILKAAISLYNFENKEIAQIKFYNDKSNLPSSDTVSSSDYIECHYLAERYAEVVDLLRYEKPVFLHFNITTNVSHLSTGYEPVGELESYPQNISPWPWPHRPFRIP